MKDSFHFGLEAEFMLAKAKSFDPLWYKAITFKELDEILTSISLDHLPSLEGLSAEPPHEKLMPFIVEGYGIPDKDMNIVDAYPKGIEIRTPVCESLNQVLEVYKDLYGRVSRALEQKSLTTVAISHHPIEYKFSGPQNKRRHDFWMWAQEVMTTYGPDINVSFPSEINQKLFSDIDNLNQKINYYAPSMAALSLASPFLKGNPWIIKGQRGLSYRTFKRSVIAPAIELHPDENERIEFKVFEMSSDVADFEAYFTLVLGLFLSFDLSGRASSQERIYDSGNVARFGLRAENVDRVLGELFEHCEVNLPKLGFSTDPLKRLHDRFERKHHISDEMLMIFDETQSIQAVMKYFSGIKDSRSCP